LQRLAAADGVAQLQAAVGDDADSDSLERLATIGKGEFFMVTDPDLLPRIFFSNNAVKMSTNAAT
jgi:hypothetical protein